MRYRSGRVSFHPFLRKLSSGRKGKLTIGLTFCPRRYSFVASWYSFVIVLGGGAAEQVSARYSGKKGIGDRRTVLLNDCKRDDGRDDAPSGPQEDIESMIRAVHG